LYPYSQRLRWDVSANSLTQSIQAKRSAGIPLLDLTVSNPTEAFSDYPHGAIHHACAHVQDFSYRPDPFGQERARSAIAELYAKRGVAISADRLVLTASTSEAYALLFKLFGDPGSEILAPVPSYPLFEYLAALESVRVAPYRLVYDGAWFVDWRSLRENIGPNTRAIVIVNPNNPTGSFLKRHEAEELFQIARQYELPVISDEVFFDYSIAESADTVKTLIGSNPLLSFSLDGLSKTAGMPQMKLGWMAMNGAEDQVQVARGRLELLLDTYLSVSTPVQQAAPQLLRVGAKFQTEIMARIRRNLGTLRQSLQDAPAHALHIEGGWSAIVQLPRTLSEETWVMRLLEEHSVMVQPGYFFDMAAEAYVVVSLITPPEEFAEGIVRLRALAVGI
jgi:hypothetical protein